MVRCIHAHGLHFFHCSRHCARGLGGNDVIRTGDVPIACTSDPGIPADVTRATERVRLFERVRPSVKGFPADSDVGVTNADNAIGVAGADGNIGIGNVDKDVGVANAPLRAERGARSRPL